jgi:hypothetical protein
VAAAAWKQKEKTMTTVIPVERVGLEEEVVMAVAAEVGMEVGHSGSLLCSSRKQRAHEQSLHGA